MLDSGRYDGGSSLNTSRLPSAVDHVINMALGSKFVFVNVFPPCVVLC